MRVAFLTNNPNISDSLFEWLNIRENALYVNDLLSVDFLLDYSIEFIVSYNYKYIIKKDIIDLLPNRIINLHTSFLPYNRGADPNIWSFIDGSPCGVTIHQVNEGLDTGDILLQQSISFDTEIETLSSSYEKLHQLIQELFINNWELLKQFKIKPVKQVNIGTTHKKSDLLKYAQVIDYNDKVSDFLQKIKEL